MNSPFLYFTFKNIDNIRAIIVHSEHANGFSPVCIFAWLFRLDFSVNRLLHSEQANGFSPVSIIAGLARIDFRLGSFSTPWKPGGAASSPQRGPG